ncbi:translation initiation factor [Haloglomus halophilum]|uniref:translation initiation factor n=1 Tax=Haloglomus halophilum TaxID=2962672 RepID=UPI003313ABA9
MAEDPSDIAGLPAELGIDDDLARADASLRIRLEKRRYGKPVTIVEGFDDVDLAALASELKRALGTGGTVDEDSIELQGDHADRVPALLRERGFTVDG